MRFKDLSGKTHQHDISKYKKEAGSVSKSKGQEKLGTILMAIYPNVPLYEEVPCFGEGLYLDFLMPSIKLAFEFDGAQHEEYNPFFHGDRYTWLRSRNRDSNKESWCERNGYSLVRVTDEELSEAKVKGLINDRSNTRSS